MQPAHLWQQAFQECRHELVEAVRGNPDNVALRAQLAQVVHDLEGAQCELWKWSGVLFPRRRRQRRSQLEVEG
jgi:hypothetical protein